MKREELIVEIVSLMNENDLEYISFFGRGGKWHKNDGINYEIMEINFPDLDSRTITTSEIPSYSFEIVEREYNLDTMNLSKLQMFKNTIEKYLKEVYCYNY